MEALICQNYGWICQNLDDSETAEKFILSAITFYKANGFNESVEYITAKYNLSLVYSNQNRFEENLSLLFELYDNIDKINESNSDTEVYICSGIVFGLLAKGQEENAYSFTIEKDKLFSNKYGKRSVERIDFLQKSAGGFRCFGFPVAFKFLKMAEKLIQKEKLKFSVVQANQLNQLGVAFWFLQNDLGVALRLLNEAKELLEKLGEQNSILYEIVCQNIEQAKEEQFNDLIKKMAKTMLEENEED